MTELILSLPTEASQLEFGGKLALHCRPPLIIFLHGPLGAGKTTFVRGFLRGLGYTEKVKSPSYNLVESYELSALNIYHFDFYRIQDARELEFLGLQDYWSASSLFLIEWPEQGQQLLPPPDLACYFEFEGPGRKLRIEAKTALAEKILSKWL